MNPGDMLTDLRDNLDEASAGEWSDAFLWRALNRSYKFYCRKCLEHDPLFFTGKTTISLVADQQEYSLGLQRKVTKILWVEDITTDPYTSQIPIDFRKRLIWEPGSDTAYGQAGRYHYYIRDWKIGLSPTPDTAESDVLDVYYAFIPEDLHYGTLGAIVASTSVVLGKTVTQGAVKSVNDVYNGEWIEVNNYRAQITDYVGSTKVATVAFDSDPAEDATYYLVPQIEEDFWDLPVLRATIRALARVEDDTSDWRVELQDRESDFYASLNARQNQEPRYVNYISG